MKETIIEFLNETITTKRNQRRKIEKLKASLKESEEKIDKLNERVTKWTNTARYTNKELEELKSKYSELKINSSDTIAILERKVVRLEKKVEKYESK